MCKEGITDSTEYLKEALKAMKGIKVEHISISIEALKPKFSAKIDEMRSTIANLLHITDFLYRRKFLLV